MLDKIHIMLPLVKKINFYNQGKILKQSEIHDFKGTLNSLYNLLNRLNITIKINMDVNFSTPKDIANVNIDVALNLCDFASCIDLINDFIYILTKNYVKYNKRDTNLYKRLNQPYKKHKLC